MIHKKVQTFVLLMFVTLLMAACENNSTPPPSPTGASASPTTGYPAPDTGYSNPEVDFPAIGYPSLDSNGILLAFDKPIQPDDTVITGVGPAGLAVYILNMTFMGTELGSGVIGDDGKFSVQVSELQRGTRIGLTADVTTVGLTEADIQPGDGVMAVPRVGYFYDTFVIPQP